MTRLAKSLRADLERLAGGSNLERTFETIWRQLGGPELEREYRFHPKRKWRADFAHPRALVLIEVEGGTWTHGRHNRGAGYRGDCIKYNHAALLGYRVFRFTADMLTPEHIEPVIEEVHQMLRLNP